MEAVASGQLREASEIWERRQHRRHVQPERDRRAASSSAATAWTTTREDAGTGGRWRLGRRRGGAGCGVADGRRQPVSSSHRCIVLLAHPLSRPTALAVVAAGPRPPLPPVRSPPPGCRRPSTYPHASAAVARPSPPPCTARVTRVAVVLPRRRPGGGRAAARRTPVTSGVDVAAVLAAFPDLAGFARLPTGDRLQSHPAERLNASSHPKVRLNASSHPKM